MNKHNRTRRNGVGGWLSGIACLAALFVAAAPFQAASADDVHLAVATNFKPAVEALKTTFEAQGEHRVIISTGSSGLLYAQIVNGAPYHIFMSADQVRPERLEDTGLAVAGTRQTYAIGQLALWHPGPDPVGPDSLRRSDLRSLAIANPRLAPYGAAAIEVLTALGVFTALEPRLLRGENVGQAFAYVRTRNAELGLVSLSQIRSLPAAERGAHWRVPPSLHKPIRQDMILLAAGRNNSAASAFMNFLEEPGARRILEDFGYGEP